jgi:hypothetical protein
MLLRLRQEVVEVWGGSLELAIGRVAAVPCPVAGSATGAHVYHCMSHSFPFSNEHGVCQFLLLYFPPTYTN